MAVVRMSEAQAALLFGDDRKASGVRRPRLQQRRENLPENILEAQINGFLAKRGWKTIRQQSGLWVPWHQFAGKDVVKVSTLRPNRFGEKGISDWMAVRVLRPGPDAQFFIYEVKGGGRAPTPEQIRYLEHHRAVGFITAWFDAYEGEWDTSFLPWYERHFGEFS